MNKNTPLLSFLIKVFVIVLAIAVFFSGAILKNTISSLWAYHWDTDINIEKVAFDWQLPGIVLSEVHVGQPYGFPRGKMLDMERVEVSFKNGFGLSSGGFHPDRIEVWFRDIELMRRVSGHWNLRMLADSVSMHRNKRGIKLLPEKTLIHVGRVVETDASQPILQKKEFKVDKTLFEINSLGQLQSIVKAFIQELELSLSLNTNGEEKPLLPAPVYHGVIESVEQELREQAQEKASAEKGSSDIDK